MLYRVLGLDHCTMFVMSMIGVVAAVSMGSWRSMTFYGLTATTRILKPCRKLYLIPSFFPASSFMFALGKNDCICITEKFGIVLAIVKIGFFSFSCISVVILIFLFTPSFRHTGNLECANNLSLVYTPKRCSYRLVEFFFNVHLRYALLTSTLIYRIRHLQFYQR